MNGSMLGFLGRMLIVGALAVNTAACAVAEPEEGSDSVSAASDLSSAAGWHPLDRFKRLSCFVEVSTRSGHDEFIDLEASYDANHVARIQLRHLLSFPGHPLGSIEGTLVSQLTRLEPNGAAAGNFTSSYDVDFRTGATLHGSVTFEDQSRMSSFLAEKDGALVYTDFHTPVPQGPDEILVYTQCRAQP